MPEPKTASPRRRPLKDLWLDDGTLVPTHAYGLPGTSDGPPAPARLSIRRRKAALALAVAGLVVAVAGAFTPLWWLLLLLAVPASAALAWLSIERGVRLRRHDRRLRRALISYRPTIAMAYAGRSGGPWQLRMWEPYLLASGERCIIVNLHAKYVERILTEGEEPLRSPFVQLGSDGTDGLDDVLVPSITSLYYVQNAQRNAAFLRRRHLTHVWLNHGDSDKPANFNPRHADYDVLVVCGQAGIDRYARHGIHVDAEKFEVLGRPQASGVEPARGPIRDVEEKVVLYAPTWHGLDPEVNFSSLELGPQIVTALLARGVRVVFRPHPLSYRWARRRAVIKEIKEILREHRDAGGPRHAWGKLSERRWSVVDCTNRSDALISDVSSVVSDWLPSGKPYAMTSLRAGVEEFREEYAVAQSAYVLLGDLSNLEDVLDDLLERDPLEQAREERRRYVLGDLSGRESADAFAAFVRQVAADGR